MNRDEFYTAWRSIRLEAANSAKRTPPRSSDILVTRILHIAGREPLRLAARASRQSQGHSAPGAEITAAIIVDRPARQRIAQELSWAAHYRILAKQAWSPNLRQTHLAAAKLCCSDAHEMQRLRAQIPG